MICIDFRFWVVVALILVGNIVAFIILTILTNAITTYITNEELERSRTSND